METTLLLNLHMSVKGTSRCGSDSSDRQFGSFGKTHLKSTPGAFKSDNFNNKYEMKNKIGAGKFSSVHLAKSRLSGRDYAVKMIEKDKLKPDEKDLLK